MQRKSQSNILRKVNMLLIKISVIAPLMNLEEQWEQFYKINKYQGHQPFGSNASLVTHYKK